MRPYDVSKGGFTEDHSYDLLVVVSEPYLLPRSVCSTWVLLLRVNVPLTFRFLDSSHDLAMTP